MEKFMKKHSEVAPNAIDKHVGNRIILRRNMLGMTQKALADKCGITFQQMQKYEKATNRISVSRLFQIGMALDSPASFFFSGLPLQTVDNSMFLRPNKYDINAIKRISEPSDADPLARMETLRLINYYWDLPNDKARETIINLLKTMTTP